MKSFIHRILFLAVAGPWSAVQAQQIDLSLHATATPDSFEVRARATSGVYTAVPNAVFTLRWEVASGGVANNSDVRNPCGAYSILNFGGSVDVGAYRYFTLVLFGNRDLATAGCPIDTAGMVVCTVRIRQMSGCRNVSLVQNAYTGMNNLDYYFSIGGLNATGLITSAPISAGDCSGCVPPMIATVQVGDLPECGNGPLAFSVVATGTDLDYSWQSPTGAWIGHAASGALANGAVGLYTVTVSNACGSATGVAQTGFDPELCDPAELLSAWFELVPPAAQHVRLHTQGTGSCLSYRWVFPNGWVYNSTTPVSAADLAVPGTYTFILFSACGSDTLQLELTPEMICLPPEIQQVSSSAPLQICNMEPFSLNVQATQDPTYVWTGPDGVWTASGGSVVLDPPQAGPYKVRAINSCGVDSAFITVQLDTAGLAACVPPVIHGITSEPICIGDTLWLYAAVEATGPCLSYNWSGVNLVGSNGPSAIVPNAPDYPIQLEVVSGCGTASLVYDPPMTPLDYSLRELCGAVGPVDLDSAYAGFMVEGGYWHRDGLPVIGVYDPAVDTNTYYQYRWPNGCDRLQVYMNDLAISSAGEDAYIRICSDSDPADLFTLLGPAADAGGFWGYGWDQLVGGVFDPNEFIGALTWHFRYQIGIGPCMDTAYVTVEEVTDPFPWHIDTDGDGLGDPLDSLLSCDPVEGYVQNATDECPLVFGTVGDPCDDGNAATQDDVITEACICAGELGTSVAEVGGAPLRLWPNPAHGGAFFLQVPLATGPLSVALHDAMGRVVWQGVLPASPSPLEVQLPEGTAAGSYVVSVLAANGRWVQRLAVD